MQLLQYARNVYNCRFRATPHGDLNDGTLSPQSTKYSMWTPISLGLGQYSIVSRGVLGIGNKSKLKKRLLTGSRKYS